MNARIYAGFMDELRKIKLANFGTLATHAAEVGGLGILARPTIQKMRGKQVSPASEHAHELGGLGVLAAPSAIHLGQSAVKGLAKLKHGSVVAGALSIFKEKKAVMSSNIMSGATKHLASGGTAHALTSMVPGGKWTGEWKEPIKAVASKISGKTDKAAILAAHRARPKGLSAFKTAA